MITLERDADFWIRIASHPEVSKTLLGYAPENLRDFVHRPTIYPLASEHGGFIFVQLDNLAHVYELHTLFTPEGWGREALKAAREAARWIFEKGSLIVTYEVEGNWRSRPPKSFGFKSCGPFSPALGTSLKLWSLSREDFERCH